MKVMLVYPNDRMDSLIGVAIPLLSAYLKKEGHEVKLFDTTFIDTGKREGSSFREDLGQVGTKVDLSLYGVERKIMTLQQLQNNFRREVLHYNPGLIGFSALEMTYDQGLSLVKSIADIKIPKIFGGIYPTFAPRIVLREPAIDMICEGEGEQMLPELASALEKKGDITSILNLTLKKDGKIYRSGKIVELEDLPTGDDVLGKQTGLRYPPISLGDSTMPDYTIFDQKRFWKKMNGQAVRTVAMELSRGCPFGCTFCCVPMQRKQHDSAREQYAQYSRIELSILKEEHPFHREKPINKLIDEIKCAIDSGGINYIYFTDESFLAMSSERFHQFIESYKNIKLPFFIESRAETIKLGHAEALESVGCVGIAIGIESGSPKVRKDLLKRFMSDDQIIKAFKEFKKTNIKISANNIIGFPFETREDIMKTIEINREVNPGNVLVNAFRPYSGTMLRKVCIDSGLIPPEERVEDNRVYGAFFNGVLQAEELEGIRRVFPLYVKFPKERWPEIRVAESNLEQLEILKKEFAETFK